LSVFAGGCTLETAEAVCDTTLERLSTLVDHHLVVRSVDPHGSRYSLLETIREFAAERLEDRGEGDSLRRRHAVRLLAVARTFGLSVDELGSGVTQRHDLALAEQDDLRAALDWALDADPELGLELAVALEQFWVATSPREGLQRFEELLDRAGPLAPELRARALRDLGGSAQVAGERERAAAAYAESLAVYERVGDEIGIVRLRHRLSGIAVERGDLAGARELIEETLLRARAGGLRYEESDLLGILSHVEFGEGNVERALDLQLAAIGIVRELGGWPWGEALRLTSAAGFALLLDRIGDAESYGRQALALSREVGDRITMAGALAVLAASARASAEDERAGRLWGAIEAEEQRAFLGRWSSEREEYASRVLADATAELEQGLEHGRRLTFDEVATYVLEP
jgi:hypothetical protein